MTNDFITDPTWTGLNRLHVRALVDFKSRVNPDGYLRELKRNMSHQLAESILSKPEYFKCSSRTDLIELVQADAVVLTESEYFSLCERMYRKGFERGRWA